LARDGKENALITHADHYTTNTAYSTAAYSKGETLLAQLGYIIGEDVRDRGLLRYYEDWKFKHPTSTDFKRSMERESGFELDWYFEYFERSTHTIDYAISEVIGNSRGITLTLERIGVMPMPVDLVITFRDGSQIMYNLPLEMMRSNKAAPTGFETNYVVLQDWPWTHPTRTLELEHDINEIESIEIDPARGMADLDRSNNRVDIEPNTLFYFKN
jgi:aminopeptidase N